MAFKMKGFNPGKGTGMGQGFPNIHVVLNPNTRDDPNAAEYIEWYTKKYGRPPTEKEMKDKIIKKEFKVRIVSEESVFLGKKCYCDKLVAQGDDGGEIYGVDYHIRMKGVSGDAIDDKLLEEDIDPIELYKQLFDGEEITFDLACRGKKACFETMEDGTMTTREIFQRLIKFKKD